LSLLYKILYPVLSDAREDVYYALNTVKKDADNCAEHMSAYLLPDHSSTPLSKDPELTFVLQQCGQHFNALNTFGLEIIGLTCSAN